MTVTGSTLTGAAIGDGGSIFGSISGSGSVFISLGWLGLTVPGVTDLLGLRILRRSLVNTEDGGDNIGVILGLSLKMFCTEVGCITDSLFG